MTELKVYCDCGQKYKFEVEPVNNQMPFAVACPICQRDGTGKANALLQQMLIFKPLEQTPPPTSPSSAPPMDSAPPVLAAPARLRVNVPVPAAEPAALSAPRPIAPARVILPHAMGRTPATATATGTGTGKTPSFGLGLLGGFLGALVGSLIYYFIFKSTGVSLFLALGVGGLSGWTASWMGKGEGSKELGGIVVVFVLAGVLAAQYFVLLGQWNKILDLGYTAAIQEAQEVVKAVSTGSDSEIKSYLARQASEDGDIVKPDSVTDDQVKDFREKELPHLQALASGKISKEQFLVDSGADPAKAKNFESESAGDFKGYFILAALNLRSIILMVAAAGLAFRLSTNA